jgi:hypothetical protein
MGIRLAILGRLSGAWTVGCAAGPLLLFAWSLISVIGPAGVLLALILAFGFAVAMVALVNLTRVVSDRQATGAGRVALATAILGLGEIGYYIGYVAVGPSLPSDTLLSVVVGGIPFALAAGLLSSWRAAPAAAE